MWCETITKHLERPKPAVLATWWQQRGEKNTLRFLFLWERKWWESWAHWMTEFEEVVESLWEISVIVGDVLSQNTLTASPRNELSSGYETIQTVSLIIKCFSVSLFWRSNVMTDDQMLCIKHICSHQDHSQMCHTDGLDHINPQSYKRSWILVWLECWMSCRHLTAAVEQTDRIPVFVCEMWDVFDGFVSLRHWGTTDLWIHQDTYTVHLSHLSSPTNLS